MRDRKAELPEAANGRVKALRQVFKFAIANEHMDHNPAENVPYLRTTSEGFHTWTLEEVLQYIAKHPFGTKAYLALALLLFTGPRRSTLGPCGNLTFLVTEFNPAVYFKVREWCDQAGLPHCTARGLRKAGACIAAENGATERQLMAIFGW